MSCPCCGANNSTNVEHKEEKKKKEPEPFKGKLNHDFVDKYPAVKAEDFEWREILGEGAFAVVTRVIRKSDNLEMACKRIDTRDFSKGLARQQGVEVRTMQELTGLHKCIVDLYDIMVDNNGTDLLLFMECCKGGTLQNKNDPRLKGTNNLKRIFRQIFEGLRYLHGKHIAHLDLKLENVCFLNKETFEIRILDFGITAKRDAVSGKNVGFRGTLQYMAPEVMLKKPYTEQADIWSCGVMMYELLASKLPFKVSKYAAVVRDMNSTYSQRHRIISKVMDTEKIEWPFGTSPRFQQLLCALFSLEPADRPTPSDILTYDWFGDEASMTSEVVQSFSEYAHRGKLQQALTPLMLKHVETIDQRFIDHATAVHTHTDKDLNGGFDFEEFIICLGEIPDVEYDREDAREIFDSIDENGDGEVVLEEFMQWFAYDYITKQDERLWKFIRSLDKEGNGYLNVESIALALKDVNTDEEVEKTMKEIKWIMKSTVKYSPEYFAQILLGN